MSAATLLPKLKRFRRRLVANANYAWWGPDATLSAWPCAVTGTVATAGGTGLTLRSLSGVACPEFGGGAYFATATFATINQPCAHVIACRPDDISARRSIVDGGGGARQYAFVDPYSGPNGIFSVYAGTAINSIGFAALASALVAVIVYNGASSSVTVYRDGTVYSASGNTGAQSLTRIVIGGNFGLAHLFDGPIALISIFHGTNYAARAATIVSGARTLIGV